MTPTQDECIQAAAQLLAAADRRLAESSIDEAVDAAYTPTGPSKEELRRRISAEKNAAHREAS